MSRLTNGIMSSGEQEKSDPRSSGDQREPVERSPWGRRVAHCHQVGQHLWIWSSLFWPQNLTIFLKVLPGSWCVPKKCSRHRRHACKTLWVLTITLIWFILIEHVKTFHSWRALPQRRLFQLFAELSSLSGPQWSEQKWWWLSWDWHCHKLYITLITLGWHKYVGSGLGRTVMVIVMARK